MSTKHRTLPALEEDYQVLSDTVREFADEVVAPARGLKLDSIFAVVSRYSKLVPVVAAACLIEPATFRREASTPAEAVALKRSTAIDRVPCGVPAIGTHVPSTCRNYG